MASIESREIARHARRSLVVLSVTTLAGFSLAAYLDSPPLWATTVGAESNGPVELSWYRFSSCIPNETTFEIRSTLGEVERLACGERGVFYLAAGNMSYRGTACASETDGRETFASSSSPPWSGEVARPKRRDDGMPWAALLETDDERGRSLVRTIRQFSDFQVEVALYSPASPVAPGVTEAGLLTAFCALAQELEDSPTNQPQAVVTSLGRPLRKGEDQPCSGGSGASLSCELRRLVDLFVERGSVVVAAAGDRPPGNFPAGYRAVLATGVLDLAWLDASGGEVRASSRTPAIARALVPAHVCLESADGELRAPPAGSSYAAAAFAGWLAGYLAYHDVPEPAAGRWSPAPIGGRWYLARDGAPLPGSDLQQVQVWWRRLFGEDSYSCWSGGPTARRPAVAALGELELWKAAKPLSFDPTPVPTGPVCPCIPCSGSLVSGDFVIDLGESTEPDPCEETEGLSVQVGDRVYDLVLATEDLEGLRRATVGSLVLPGLAAVAAPGEELSLIRRLRGDDGSVSFSSTPILIPDGRDRRLILE